MAQCFEVVAYRLTMHNMTLVGFPHQYNYLSHPEIIIKILSIYYVTSLYYICSGPHDTEIIRSSKNKIKILTSIGLNIGSILMKPRYETATVRQSEHLHFDYLHQRKINSGPYNVHSNIVKHQIPVERVHSFARLNTCSAGE